MGQHSLLRVRRACRVKTARGGEKRRHGEPIRANGKHGKSPHDEHETAHFELERGEAEASNAIASSCCTTCMGTAPTPSLAMTITSCPSASRAGWRRKTSRMRRFSPFLVTASPTLRLTVTPSLASPDVRRMSNTKLAVRRFSPVRPNDKNSRRRRMRAALGKPWPCRGVISAASEGSRRSVACDPWHACA